MRELTDQERESVTKQAGDLEAQFRADKCAHLLLRAAIHCGPLLGKKGAP